LALPRQIAAYAYQTASRPFGALDGAQPEQLLETLQPGLSLREKDHPKINKRWRLRGKRAAVLLFSYYPADPRPRRAAEALVMEGVVVELVCLQQNPEQPRREVISGVNVFRVPLQRRRRGKIRYISQYSAFILRSFFYLG